MVGPTAGRHWIGWGWLCIVACASPNPSSDDDPIVDAGSNDGTTSDAASGPTTITVTLTERTNPLDRFVAAYRDGSGAWAIAAPTTADTFAFVVTSPTWSFAWACEGVSSLQIYPFAHVLSFAVSEKTSFHTPEDCPRPSTAIRVSGTLAGTVSGTDYEIAWGGRDSVGGAQAFGTSTSYALRGTAGTHDLYVGAQQGETIYAQTTSAVAIVRGVIANTDTSNIDVDMRSAVATLAELPVTIQGIQSEDTFATTTLYDVSGTSFDIAWSRFDPPHTTRGIAPSQLVAGSVYEQQVRATWCPPSAYVGEYCDERVVEHWRTTIAAQTVNLPQPLGTVTATAQERGMRATWAPYPNAIGYTWVANKGYYPEVAWRGMIGTAYAATAPSFEIPDLSGLPGWDRFIPAAHGDSVIVGLVRAYVSSSGPSDFPFVYPAMAGADRSLLEGRIKITY